jgi:glycerate 2-kinase
MIKIRNKRQLVANGQTAREKRARRVALESLESALSSVDPRKIVKSKIAVTHSILTVNGHSFDLRKFRKVYVVGGGKASGSMSEALEKLLGKRIVAGHVNVPRGSKIGTRIIELTEASHPIPDEAGVEGARIMCELAQQASKEKALMISLISGGGSSLMPLPLEGITITDKGKVTNSLLKSGATINEINTVRKHLSEIKGGWLAKKAYPATVLNLILSDVVGDPLDFIASGPTVPDSTTFEDAVKILKKYELWSEVPASVKKVLQNGEKGIIPETPKTNDRIFRNVCNVVIGNNRSASVSARDYIKSAGLNALMLTSTLEGEARHVGTILGSIASEVIASGNPVDKPTGIVAGGETTVTVKGTGLGGRNQEIALAAASKISKLTGVIVASISTDGIDGPTEAAGAIVDGKTLARARRLGLTPDNFLQNNDSNNFFSKLDDLIFTGPTGTNVNDVSVIVVV